MRPAVDALSRRFRVLSFTLAGEPASGEPLDPHLGFETFVAQAGRVLDAAAVRQAIVCGVSYGGLIALRYAALEPARVRGLVLVSAPPPDYHPDAVVEGYLRAPWLMAPLFLMRATGRGVRELRRALPRWGARVAAAGRQARNVLLSPTAPHRMSQRVGLLHGVDFMGSARQCRQIPTLLIVGERDLDRVVSVDGTLRYGDLLEDVSVHRMERTGHLGLVLQPERFAEAIAGFVAALDRGRDDRSERAG
jgi:pimeloyl-ACP methyl ester carboxylesterase